MYHIEKPFHKLVKKWPAVQNTIPLPMGDDRGKKKKEGNQ